MHACFHGVIILSKQSLYYRERQRDAADDAQCAETKSSSEMGHMDVHRLTGSRTLVFTSSLRLGRSAER